MVSCPGTAPPRLRRTLRVGCVRSTRPEYTASLLQRRHRMEHRMRKTPARVCHYKTPARFSAKQCALRGARGVGPPAASLSPHVVAFPFLRFVGSVFVPEVLLFEFAAFWRIG